MKLGIDPKVDYAFKWLFGKEEHIPLLLSLINAVLKLPEGRQIVALEILNPHNDKQSFDDKLSILDIKARDDQGRLYNIEMQMLASAALLSRLLYYWAVLHAGQLHEGEDYEKLRPTISISFVNGVLFPEVETYHQHFQLRSGGLLFNDQLSLHVVELPKFHLAAENLKDLLDAWSYFLIHGETLDPANLPEVMRHTPVAQATEKLHMFAQDSVERERYEARLKGQRDYTSFLKDARKEGIAEGEKIGLEKGLELGLEQGLEKGELMGSIRMCQLLLKVPATPKEALSALPVVELQTMLAGLEKQLPQS